MRIMILDDSNTKCNWIKEVLKKENIDYQQFYNFKGAMDEILSEAYCGIILDMRFPLSENSGIENDYAGKFFLQELKRKNIKIPVLGNSTIGFRCGEEYECYKGKLSGYYTPDDAKKLIEFLENIKEQS